MANQWFYKHEGEKFGPVSTEQLKSLAAAMRISPADLIWKDGMAEWASAARLKGLFPDRAADQAASASNASPEAAQPERSAPDAPGTAAVGPQTFGDRLKAAGTLATKQATRAKLVTLTLPNAYKTLGRHIEKTETFKREYPELFEQYTALRAEMSSLAGAAAARPATAGFKAKVRATAVAAKEMAQNKRTDHRISQVLVELGKTAFERNGERSGPAEIVGSISEVLSRIQTLDAAIARLSESERGRSLTPERMLFRCIAALTMIVTASAIYLVLHSSKAPNKAAGTDMSLSALPGLSSSIKSELTSTHHKAASPGTPAHSTDHEVVDLPKQTLADPVTTESLSYDLNPTGAYQQMDALTKQLSTAPQVFRFYIVTRLDDNSYEIAWTDWNWNPTNGDHALLKTVFKTFSSNGKAQMAMQLDGSETVHLDNGFDKSLSVFREAVSDSGTRALTDNEVDEQRTRIMKRISTSEQIMRASLVDRTGGSDRRQQPQISGGVQGALAVGGVPR